MNRNMFGNRVGKRMDEIELGNGANVGNAYGSGEGGMSNGMVCLAILLVLLLGLLIWALIWLGSISSHVNTLHIHTFCPEGATCHDGALVGGSGVCDANGVCVGTALGQCDGGFFCADFSPDDCRNLTWSWPVAFFGLFNDQICWMDMCVWFLLPELPLEWTCVGSDHGRHELKELGARRCRSYIANDEDAPFFDVTLTCIFDEPICIFAYRRAEYTCLEPLVAPFATLGAGEENPVAAALGDGGLLEYIGHAVAAHKGA